jgi:hypothetical protein
MYIERKHLIELCEIFLNGEIQAIDVKNFAWNCVESDDTEWDENDDIIFETIFDWDNEEISFPINIVNMKLWKNRLENDVDELKIYNNWNVHIDKQKDICEKYGSIWKPIHKSLNIAISENLDLETLNGLRLKTEKGEVCWFIWSGEYSEEDNFFQPICAEHLMQRKPKLIAFLGLDEGFRFLMTEKGYEDVWFDEKLLETEKPNA